MHTIAQNESTAARRRVLVYLVDDTDGKTAETGVTVAAGDIKVSINGGAEANHAGTWGEIGGGTYYYELGTSEVSTLGIVSVRVVKSGCRQFVKELQVVGQSPYATIYAVNATQWNGTPVSSAVVNANTTQWGGTAVGSVTLPASVAGTVTANVTQWGGTAVASAVVNANVTQFGGSAGSFASGRPQVNTTHWNGTAVGSVTLPASVSGTVSANVTQWDGTAAASAVVNASVSALGSGIANDIADALLTRTNGVETGLTVRQALRAIAAVLAGRITTAGTATEVFEAAGNPGTTRVTVSVDESGNRSTVTLAV